MNLPEELVSELVKVTNNNASDKNDNTAYGTVVDNGDRLYVQLDGAGEGVLTPIETTVSIKAGDRVRVSIRNHTAVVTGNVEDISASLSKLLEVIKIADDLGVEINKRVTFTGLEDGSTTIDGSCIKTGTIDAARINMSGAISWGALDTTLANKITTAQDTADTAAQNASAALYAANGASGDASDAIDILNYLTDRSETADGTYIDGAKIATESIYTNSIRLGGLLNVYNTSKGSTVGGQLGYNNGTSSTKGIGLWGGSNLNAGQVVCTDQAARLSFGPEGNRVIASSTNITLRTDNSDIPIYFTFGNTETFKLAYNFISPRSGSITATLGTTKAYWAGLYSETCTCCPSDRNRKNSIADLPEKYITLFDNLTPKRFKLNRGTSNRYHTGYIAQEVEDAMKIAGIDSQEFGGFVKDVDEEDGSDIYMLRYGEFDAIYAAKIKQLESRIDELEKRLKSIEEVG